MDRTKFLNVSTGSFRELVRFAVLCLLLFNMGVVSATEDDPDAEIDIVTLTGDYQKQQFIAGDIVEARNASILDDIFAAGRSVTLDSVSSKYTFAAAMSLSLKDIEAEDVIIAGGQIDLSGVVIDDVIAAAPPFRVNGGRVHLRDDLKVGDDVRVVGHDVVVDGEIGGDLYVIGKRLSITGDIAGDIRVEADSVSLSETASVGGNLLYAGENPPRVADGASVQGEIRQIDSKYTDDDDDSMQWKWWYGVIALTGLLVALILFVIAVQLAVPGLLSDAAKTATNKPLVSLGSGIITIILVPAVVALLMITIVGIPVGIVMMCTLLILMALALTTISIVIGTLIRERARGRETEGGTGATVLWTVVGFVTLFIVGIIPFAGWAIQSLALIAGLGAVVNRLTPRVRRSNQVPVAV